MKNGFTLIEFLIVLFIFALLIILIVSGLGFFERQTTFNEDVQAVMQTLRLAQNKTVATEDNAQYGIHFESGQVTLFKGVSYVDGNPDNQVYILSHELEISEINLQPATSTADVLFEKLSGATANSGWIRLRLVNDPTNSQLIYIEPSGQTSLLATPAATNGRHLDSRHIHVTFSRDINTATERIFLFFDGAGAPQQTIDIATNLTSGQIDWSGTVNIAGEDQVVRIHSHELNNPDTIFCFHRDRRQNTKSLRIDLESDNLINYVADGVLTNGNSVWAAAPQIQ